MLQYEADVIKEIDNTLKAEAKEPGEFCAWSALDGDDYGRGELEALKTEVARLSFLVTALSIKLLEADVIDRGQLAGLLHKAQFITRS